VPVAAPRALAFETLRETFERGAHTEVAFRAGAERLGLGGRDRAQAQRLAYGSVQRRGTADAAIERLSGRAIRLLDPPVAAALRLGLYELLFADATPDHAAVDQAVTHRRPKLVVEGERRPRPGHRRGRAEGFPADDHGGVGVAAPHHAAVAAEHHHLELLRGGGDRERAGRQLHTLAADPGHQHDALPVRHCNDCS